MTKWEKGDIAELDLEAIGGKIRSLYDKSEYKTQTEFAQSIGVNSQTKISAAMNGRQKLTIEQYSALAIQFDIPLNDLLCLPSDPTGTRLSPRDICRMLVDIFNSEYDFKIEGTPEEGMMLISQGVSRYDDMIPRSSDSDSLFSVDSLTRVEEEGINNFLEAFKKLVDIKENNRLEDDMYKRVLESYLNDLPG